MVLATSLGRPVREGALCLLPLTALFGLVVTEYQFLLVGRKLATCFMGQLRGVPWNFVPETLSRAQASRHWKHAPKATVT